MRPTPLPAAEYLAAHRDNEWIRDLTAQWLRAHDTGEGKDAVAAFEARLTYKGEPDALLSVIVAVGETMTDGRHETILAAGLLEDFLADHGEDFLNVIADLATLSPRFRHLLGGVWRGRMKKGVWHQIEAIRGRPW